MTSDAGGSSLLGVSLISNGANGIVLDGADDVSVYEMGAIDNTANGIVLNGTEGVSLVLAGAEGNGGYGLWLKGASFNSITQATFLDNTIAGVYLGCHASGPSSAACAIPPSDSNVLLSIEVGSDCPTVAHPQAYGIAIDVGNRKNHVFDASTSTGCSGSGDTTFDGFDGNPGANCAGNFWYNNKLTSENHKNSTANPLCMQ